MKFGVIGFGNMGGAIVRGALKKGTLKKEDVNVFDILDIRNQEALVLKAAFHRYLARCTTSRITYRIYYKWGSYMYMACTNDEKVV